MKRNNLHNLKQLVENVKKININKNVDSLSRLNQSSFDLDNKNSSYIHSEKFEDKKEKDENLNFKENDNFLEKEVFHSVKDFKVTKNIDILHPPKNLKKKILEKKKKFKKKKNFGKKFGK